MRTSVARAVPTVHGKPLVIMRSPCAHAASSGSSGAASAPPVSEVPRRTGDASVMLVSWVPQPTGSRSAAGGRGVAFEPHCELARPNALLWLICQKPAKDCGSITQLHQHHC